MLTAPLFPFYCMKKFNRRKSPCTAGATKTEIYITSYLADHPN